MKTKSAIGAFLALLVFVAFPTSSALAAPQCSEPDVYYEYGGPTGMQVDMDNTEDNLCLPCSSSTVEPVIYFTSTVDVPNNTNPTHSSPVFSQPIPVPYGHTVHYRVITGKACCSHQDSDVVIFDVTNPEP